MRVHDRPHFDAGTRRRRTTSPAVSREKSAHRRKAGPGAEPALPAGRGPWRRAQTSAGSEARRGKPTGWSRFGVSLHTVRPALCRCLAVALQELRLRGARGGPRSAASLISAPAWRGGRSRSESKTNARPGVVVHHCRRRGLPRSGRSVRPRRYPAQGADARPPIVTAGLPLRQDRSGRPAAWSSRVSRSRPRAKVGPGPASAGTGATVLAGHVRGNMVADERAIRLVDPDHARHHEKSAGCRRC